MKARVCLEAGEAEHVRLDSEPTGQAPTEAGQKGEEEVMAMLDLNQRQGQRRERGVIVLLN